MDLENQKRVKEFADEFGPENLVVVLGAAEGEAAGLAAETVTAGDPTFAGPLAGVQLGLRVYHVCEPEIKDEVDSDVYEEQVSMMEMVLDTEQLASAVAKVRTENSQHQL
jgi:Glycine reductase complex selenoprotein A.